MKRKIQEVMDEQNLYDVSVSHERQGDYHKFTFISGGGLYEFSMHEEALIFCHPSAVASNIVATVHRSYDLPSRSR